MCCISQGPDQYDHQLGTALVTHREMDKQTQRLAWAVLLGNHPGWHQWLAAQRTVSKPPALAHLPGPIGLICLRVVCWWATGATRQAGEVE